jgi:hypothetical protein
MDKTVNTLQCVPFNQITMKKIYFIPVVVAISFFRAKKEDTTVIKKSSGKINIAGYY